MFTMGHFRKARQAERIKQRPLIKAPPRAVVLSLQQVPCSNTDCWAHFQSFWFSISGVGPQNLHFQQVPRWCWCCWSGDGTLRTTGLVQNTDNFIYTYMVYIFYCFYKNIVSPYRITCLFYSTNSTLYMHFSIHVLCAAAEQAQKARKEIADHLAAGKDEWARIRVEHIIQEDYLVEAMEILELCCDLLLARLSLIQATK